MGKKKAYKYKNKNDVNLEAFLRGKVKIEKGFIGRFLSHCYKL